MSCFPGFMKKTVTRTIVILLVCMMGMNVFGVLAPKASAAAGPDLIVQAITLSPANPAIDDTVTITVTVKNQGTAVAGVSYVTCYVDSVILDSKSVSALDAGIMATATFSWKATQGTHTIKAVADSSGVVNETDETNNTDTYSITTLAPDLIIQSITWSPSNPSGGDTVTFSIVIKNQGNVQSRFTDMNFFIDNNSRGVQDVAALNPGASLTKTYTWTMLSGQHTFRAVVDITDNNKESNETNNELTVNYATGSLDLAFKAVAWSPQNPSKYDTVTCNATVINYGQGRADVWSLAYFVDNTLVSTIQGTPLESNASVNITFSWQTLQDKHDIKIILDYNNNLAETDENNNEYTVTITTLIPDLIVSDVTWLPANPSAGDNVTFTVKIKNQGSGKAAASRAASYIDNQFISNLNISSLAANAEATVTFTWVATSGTHWVKIVADYEYTLNEKNRDNNTIDVAFATAMPDLIIQNITWSPEDATINEMVTYTVNITNQGSGRAFNFHVAYFIDDVPLKSEIILQLEAGAWTQTTCQWKVISGRHTFKAIANYNNYILESDKTNNEKSIIFSPKLPDLAINGITWSPSNMPAGQNIIFSITIGNNGLISAAPSRTAFYVDGAVAGYIDIERLEPGAETLQYFTWASSEGFHTISIILDSNNQIDEIDEVNNTTVINIPLPDLIVESITFSPPDINVGENLTISAVVKNQGGSKTEKSRIYLYVDGVQITSQELLSINSGETATTLFKWAATAGQHTFKISVDNDNTVIEVNEANNEKEIKHATATPDLKVEGLSWVMSDPVNSDEATFTITIKNIGTGAAGESEVKYFFDSSPANIKKITAIPAGETASFTFIAFLSKGKHTATITADNDNAIDELDEMNNLDVITFSTIAPDLVIRTISYSPLDAKIGDTITVTVTLENRGNIEALNVRLAFFIDGAAADYADVPEINLATTITKEFQWTVIEGEHEISASIDPDYKITESNEQNNTKSRSVSFTQTQVPAKKTTTAPTNSADEDGLVEKYWWMLLLLAGLLIIAVFASTFRALRKKY